MTSAPLAERRPASHPMAGVVVLRLGPAAPRPSQHEVRA